MSTCGSSDCQTQSKRAKQPCPINGHDYVEVPYKTVLHHLAKPWQRVIKKQKYYFCTDPNCEVVYFAEDDSLIVKSELRTRVGIKESAVDALICYCFGVTRKDAESNQQAKEFVIQQTRQGTCSCETFNPSGRCCLKDFG